MFALLIQVWTVNELKAAFLLHSMSACFKEFPQAQAAHLSLLQSN